MFLSHNRDYKRLFLLRSHISSCHINTAKYTKYRPLPCLALCCYGIDRGTALQGSTNESRASRGVWTNERWGDWSAGQDCPLSVWPVGLWERQVSGPQNLPPPGRLQHAWGPRWTGGTEGRELVGSWSCYQLLSYAIKTLLMVKERGTLCLLLYHYSLWHKGGF